MTIGNTEFLWENNIIYQPPNSKQTYILARLTKTVTYEMKKRSQLISIKKEHLEHFCRFMREVLKSIEGEEEE